MWLLLWFIEDTLLAVSMSLDSIYEEVIKSKEGITMNLERLRCSLEQLDFCSEENDGYTVSKKFSELSAVAPPISMHLICEGIMHQF